MFFCLSGFVISYSGYLRPKKWWAFFYSRLARIYPAYIATAFIFIACLIILPSGAFNSTPSVSIEKIIRTLVFDFGKTGGYVYVGWTLFYEMSFYFFFAFIIYRSPSIAKNKYFHYTISTSLIICYSLGTFFYRDSALMGTQLIANRITYFIIGICIFLLSSNSLSKKKAIPSYMILVSVLLGFVFDPIGPICGIILLSLLTIEDILPKIFQSKFILIIGDSSYSIYLVQVPTVSASTKAAKWITLELPTFANNFLVFYILGITIALISTTAAGILMRKYIEKPSYAYLMRTTKSTPSKFKHLERTKQ